MPSTPQTTVGEVVAPVPFTVGLWDRARGRRAVPAIVLELSPRHSIER